MSNGGSAVTLFLAGKSGAFPARQGFDRGRCGL